MCKRLFILTLLISLLIGVSSYADPVGIFEDAVNIGDDPGIGSTLYDAATDEYLITASGHDVWDNADDFHYAY
ncbi:MAG: TolB family protein, partial [Planctomycetota bacterium]